jgi:hypothetical protein
MHRLKHENPATIKMEPTPHVLRSSSGNAARHQLRFNALLHDGP